MKRINKLPFQSFRECARPRRPRRPTVDLHNANFLIQLATWEAAIDGGLLGLPNSLQCTAARVNLLK